MRECPYCEQVAMRKDGFTNGRQRYHCKNCNRKWTEGAQLRKVREKKPPKVIKPCLQCGVETDNPKFCSKSCAATYNNQHYLQKYEKRRKKRYCKHCNKEIFGQRTTCNDCNKVDIDWSTRKISDIKRKARYQVHSHIRQRARHNYYNSDLPQHCINCGYDKHIEICHIKAIADFPVDTPVSVVNDLQNLIGLCRNCHWELDNGYLSIAQLEIKKLEHQ